MMRLDLGMPSGRFSKFKFRPTPTTPLTTPATREIRKVVRHNAAERNLVLERRLTYVAMFLVTFATSLLLLTSVAWVAGGYAPHVQAAVTIGGGGR
jgi:hypothetical protein